MSGRNLSKVGCRCSQLRKARPHLRSQKQIGVEVILARTSGPLRGMYRSSNAIAFIFINCDLDERDDANAGHELATTASPLHRQKATASEFCVTTGHRFEYEANIVASEILIDNDELLEYIYRYHYSAEQIARQMNTDINLVALKIAHLNELGYDLRPIDHRSDFLK